MIKRLVAVLCVFSMMTSMASAFTFPEPDWGALLTEKSKMVTASDFELYVESNIQNMPYYGARLEPRTGVYIGSIAEDSEKLQPLSTYLTYIEDMGQDDLYYPANNMIKNDDVVPMVGWTIHNLNNIDYNKVQKVLDTLNSYNKPMFIRFANEMNVSSLGDDPDRYIQTFRKVADMIHKYPNFAVVWAPNDLGALDRPFEYFYPGDSYVDWIGVSCYSIKYFQGNQNTEYKNSVYFMTGDYAWATNRVKPIMEFMSKKNIKKPVMISEGGVPTNNKFGENLESWATPRLRNMMWYLVMKYPQIKMVNYFDTHRAGAAERFDITNYSYAVNVFNEAKNSGVYKTSATDNAEFTFKPANSGGTLVAKDGKVKLYTLAYFEKQPELTVNYHIDGKWYHSSNKIPYICNMNISSLTDGKHTLKISTLGTSKSYDFYKNGNCIRFGAEPDSAIVAANTKRVRVLLNGSEIQFDQPPIIQNGRTLVPLRAVFDALGATVDWDNSTRTAIATKGGITITVQIDSKNMYINDEVKVLDVPAQLINSRTLVPARAVSEAFKCKVDWDDANQTVIITN